MIDSDNETWFVIPFEISSDRPTDSETDTPLELVSANVSASPTDSASDCVIDLPAASASVIDNSSLSATVSLLVSPNESVNPTDSSTGFVANLTVLAASARSSLSDTPLACSSLVVSVNRTDSDSEMSNPFAAESASGNDSSIDIVLSELTETKSGPVYVASLTTDTALSA